jgi:hypothetical protein
LGYSNIHKGFKCLDISGGRFYISRDVVLDKTVFPFAKLIPNADTCLHAENLLLPSSSATNPLPPMETNFKIFLVPMCSSHLYLLMSCQVVQLLQENWNKMMQNSGKLRLYRIGISIVLLLAQEPMLILVMSRP